MSAASATALDPAGPFLQLAGDGASESRDDPRFRRLVPAADWQTLPPAVRRRFSKPTLKGDAARLYSGHVTLCRLNPAGRFLAQALRMIGAPLPLADSSGLPTVVSVTEEGASGGQNWTRIFARRGGFPQVIHSTKQFSGPTGLQEHIGAGLLMALTLRVEDGALVFTSAAYLVSFGRSTFKLPRWLSPGRTVVRHREITAERFLFTLHVIHPLFGALVHQEAIYAEAEACDAASY